MFNAKRGVTSLALGILLFLAIISQSIPLVVKISTDDRALPTNTPIQTIPSYRKLQEEQTSISSPDQRIRVNFSLVAGVPTYNVEFIEKLVIQSSQLGFKFGNQPDMVDNFALLSVDKLSFDETWEPVWGQFNSIQNHYNQLTITLKEQNELSREMTIIFRAFDDGVAFRYHLPSQTNLSYFEITSEETYFEFTEDHSTYWSPVDWDSYEHLYRITALSDASSNGVNTPVTLKTSDGTFISIHEANLTDWAGMTLKQPDVSCPLAFKNDLVPWYGSEIKVKASTPHWSPWRTILLSDHAGGLLESTMILNLNDPCVISDPSWITPMKYIGIWWGMHRWDWTWEEGPNHGATTQRAKEYIDACVDLNCKGVLVEGWNKGWEDWKTQNFRTPTDAYSIEEVVSYGQSKGVDIIGHLETGGNVTNYEYQGIEEVFDYLQLQGVRVVKTGYASWPETSCITAVGDQLHHGQWMVNHYRRVVENAAAHQIMLDVHEPIKPTGISRTYPNMMTREGVRGQEYNAWGNPPNSPEHLTILPLTRYLAGPVDYTPEVFEFNLATSNRFSTIAHQLALYVILFSPLQMVCDLRESYYTNGDLKPECEFIRHVPVTRDETIGLQSVIGDCVTIARRNDDRWYIGSITDEFSRRINISLDFLDPTKVYRAYIYADGEAADFETNPTDTLILTQIVDVNTILSIELKRGGGGAIELIPEGDLPSSLSTTRTIVISSTSSSSQTSSFPFLFIISIMIIAFFKDRKN